MFEKVEKVQIIILSIVIGLCLILSSSLISKSITKNEITVTGSAYELVKSDNAKWIINLKASSPNRIQAYKNLEADTPVLIKFLTDNGIKEDEIEVLNTNSWEDYRTGVSGYATSEVSKYYFEKSICVKSENVDLIKEVYLKSSELVEKGIMIGSSSPEYFYSKLAEKKPALLEEATKDAKQRAAGMLKATHNRVGKIRSVRMGVFQITPADSNEVSNWGINDSSTIEKKITAVANVVFVIK